ncbi:MAG: cation diffusion facilitator family transporter [Planctomycetota bacterium]|jgi:cation diffusion facilitator family transporter
MQNNKIEIANKQITRITNLGIVGNIVLAGIKVVVGQLSGSFALVADGIHSLSDMATDLVVLLGVHFGSKGPDERHPYGHGRIETFATGLIGFTLLLVGGAMIYRGAIDIARGKTVKPHFVVLVVAVASIVIKEVLYRATKIVAVKTHSPALYANAWHHRSDALSSVAVVAGFVGLKFGFVYGDQMAAAAVGLMIILVAVRVMGDCLREFTEGAVDPKTLDHIKHIVDSDEQIRQWHKLRTRNVGREVFLDLHILVDPQLSIAAAHEIAESLETTLHEQITRPVNIMVHIEPDIPELRK